VAGNHERIATVEHAGKGRRERLWALARRLLRVYLLGVGAAASLLVLWLASPVPLYLNRPLIWNEEPAPAAAIVCLGSGADEGLPSPNGWRRIRTSVRLYHQGFAPVVIFSGGPVEDSDGRSIAEIYAESAHLIGLPEAAIVIEPLARNTADHPRRLLETAFLQSHGGTATPLLVVTTAYHGLRAALCFRRAGFSKTRVITGLEVPATAAVSSLSRPFLRRASYKLYALLAALEEWVALGAYKVRGWI
jgi:uncharacterized SAM-binding protein YcdF (DUF218 family)